MLLRSLLVVLFATVSPAHAESTPFSGVWSIQHCSADAPGQQCGGFTLVLVQKADRLCGTHFAATPNLGRIDEGAPVSVLGTAMGRNAVLFISSGRDPTSYLAKVTYSHDKLEWRLVERLSEGGAVGAPVIALDERLSRTDSTDKLARARSACEAHFKTGP
jgi:hypothetical protein